MPARRIVIIGGASAYTPGIIESIIREADVLEGFDIVLMDVDQERLTTVWRLSKQMVRASGRQFGVTMTLDRRVALKNADFVLTQYRIGGLAARAIDERLPMKYGLIGQETVGAGGLSFAWRSIPVAREIAREMAELCPEAWLLNYANPARQVTEAILRDGAFTRVIGLCDEMVGVRDAIARLMRVDHRRLALDTFGINHCNWITNLTLDGWPVLPRLQRSARFIPAGVLPDWRARVLVQLLRRFGAIPSPYLGYFYFGAEALARQRRAQRTRAEEIMARLPAIYAHYDEQAAAERPRLTKRRGVPGHGDLAVSVIAAIVADRGDLQTVNIPGLGRMPGFRPGSVVELTARIGRAGAEPVGDVTVPDGLATQAALIRTVAAAEDLNIEAAMTGSVDKAVAAMAAHPLVGPRAAAPLTAELLAAHQDNLPQFASGR
ncbi:MAG: hypothetical protein ACM3XN_00285 [Chloroflexota bacterium]